MQCKTCGYPLWSIKARQCPECGGAFRPSDFSFTLNGVRFCCPSCDQTYYGTEPSTGHLVPRAFDCVRCGTALDMDDMVLQPAEGLAMRQTRPDRMPWLERVEIGWIKAYLLTIWHALVKPRSLAKALPPESPQAQAWLFALVSTVLFSFCGLGLLFLALAMLAPLMDESVAEFLVAGAWVTGVGVTSIAGWLLVWGILAHVLLKVTGSTRSLGRTYEALCYGLGAGVLFAVPLLGWYPLGVVPLLWWLVSGTIMLATVHDASAGRAALAGIAPPAVAMLLLVAGMVGLVMFGVSQAKRATAIYTRHADTQLVVTALAAHVSEHDGRLPDHALELLLTEEADDGIGTALFIATGTATDLGEVPVDDTTIGDLDLAGPNERRLAIESAVAGQPDDVVAYRVGDFVFLDPGTEPADESLWTVVCVPDPSFPTPPEMRPARFVGLASGTTLTIEIDEWDAALEAQNALREVLGLVPLEDPGSITHDAPRRSGDAGGP